MTAMDNFLNWERASRDTIDFKKIYVDMSGDVMAGLVLSEIIYWYLPSKDGGRNKLRVEHEGKSWIAVRRYDWWERVRMTPGQADRVLNLLIQGGLIEKKVFRFNGDPTIHIRIIEDKFLASWKQASTTIPENPYLPKPGKNPFSPNDENQFSENGNPFSPNDENQFLENGIQLTKTTSEITSKTTKHERAGALKSGEGVIKNPGAFAALQAWEQNKAGAEFADYPEDVREVLGEFCNLWNHHPPRRSPKKGGEYSLWISEARDLIDACGEIGLEALRAAHSEWEDIPINDRWMVARPGSVIKIARSSAAKIRGKKPSAPSSDTWEQFREKYKYRYNGDEPSQEEYRQYLLAQK